MHLTEVLLDNRVECTFLDSKEAKNVIFCRPLEESLHNVATLQTRNEEFIHNFITESTGNYLVTDVTLSDGSTYKDVRFKLVESTDVELPCSTINLSTLGSPSTFTDIVKLKVLQPTILNESSDRVEKKEVYVENKFVSTDSTKDVFEARILEQRLRNEKTRLEEERQQLVVEQTRLDADRKLQKTLEDYKSELLHEYYLIGEKQKELLSSELYDSVGSIGNTLQEQFNIQQEQASHYLNEVATANLNELKESQDKKISKIKKELNELLNEKVENNSFAVDKRFIERSAELESLFSEKLVLELESHKQNVTSEINSITKTIDSLVSEKIETNIDKTKKILIERAADLQTEFTIKLDESLTSYKTELFDNFKTVSSDTATTLFTEKTEELNTALNTLLGEHKQSINNTLTDKLNEVSVVIEGFKADLGVRIPKLDKTIEIINDRINTLVIEKRNVQTLVDDAKKYTDTRVAQISQDAKEYARRILELGGGGGSVSQQFANGGTMNGTLNVTNGQILSSGIDIATYFGGGGGSQTLSFNSNTAALSISNGNTVSLSTLSATGSSGDPAVNSLVHSNSGLWNSSYTTLTANSGNWQSTYTTVSANSANWNSSYTTVNSNSANWSAAYTLATGLVSLSSNWQSTYTTVSTNSASWSSVYTTVSANSANWNSAYSSTTALNLSSSYWNTAYTLVQGNSASWNNALSAYTFIANGSTSIFKLSSTAPFTNAAGYIVAMNGAIQTPNTDFTITYSGNNYLNLNFTPRLGSLITVQVLGNGVVTNSSVVTVSSSTYNPLYAYVNSNFSVITPTGNYMVDTTTSGVTGLLPTTPTIGTVIGFMDPYYTWATNNFTLSAPVNIENQNQTVAMNVAGFSLKAIYVGGTYGWRLTQ